MSCASLSGCHQQSVKNGRSWILFCYYRVTTVLAESRLVWINNKKNKKPRSVQSGTETTPSKKASESETRARPFGRVVWRNPRPTSSAMTPRRRTTSDTKQAALPAGDRGGRAAHAASSASRQSNKGAPCSVFV